MPEGYHCTGEGDCSYSWLDELLCEYVDGTMDPAVRKAFEEYLASDPSVARQVERLRCTRRLLCRHGCQMRAPRGLQARMRRRLALEMMRTEPPFFSEAVARLGAAAVFASLMGVMLLAGMLVGTELYDGATVGEDRPAVTRQDGRRPGLQAAMSPFVGEQPMRLPWFVGRSAPVLLPPARSGFLPPGLLESGQPSTPLLLQRTDAAP